MWNFKDTLWNSTQNIYSIHWYIYDFYTALKFEELLDLRAHGRFWNARLGTHLGIVRNIINVSCSQFRVFIFYLSYTHTSHIKQAPVPLTVFQSNSKFDQNFECCCSKHVQSISTEFCTCHDSVTVVTCAKFCCDRHSTVLNHSTSNLCCDYFPMYPDKLGITKMISLIKSTTYH